MKWEKQEMEEIEDMLTSLSSLKSIANERLKETKDRLSVITNEIPDYIEIYKKMKGK